MTPAAATPAAPARQPRLFEGPRREAFDRAVPARRERRPCSDGGRATLGQQLDATLEALLGLGIAACPICQEPMERAGATGRCTGCGATLA